MRRMPSFVLGLTLFDAHMEGIRGDQEGCRRGRTDATAMKVMLIGHFQGAGNWKF